MAKIPLYNQEGGNLESMVVSDAVFAVPVKRSVVHQVYVAQMANQRRPWADTKDRGEVSGGGKKPWKQKGTGRARHGSIRSPIWKGGGVTFGPLSVRNYKQKINKKMNQAALRICLSDRLQDGHLVGLEAFPSDGKTKTFAALRGKLPGTGKSTLFLIAGKDASARQATHNLSRMDVATALDVNVMDVMHHQYIVLTKDAVAVLENRLKKA